MKKLLLAVLAMASIQAINAQCTNIFISEYVEGWANNKALEIYNPTAVTVNLSGYRIARYSNGQDVPPAQTNWVIALSGTIEAYGTKVIVIDQRDPMGTGQNAAVWDELDSIGSLPGNLFLCPDYNVSEAMYFNGDDAVAIETTGGVIIDLIGKIGEQPVDGGWTDVAPYNTGVGSMYTKDRTLVRKNTVKQGVTVNPASFNPTIQWIPFDPNTFSNLGAHECECKPVSVNELASTNTFSFYPNPVSNGVFNIAANSAISSVELYNVIGQVMLTQTNTGNAEMKMELADVNPGIYFVKVNFLAGQPVTKKIVVK